MPVYGVGSQKPKLDPSALIAPNATVIGDVTIGPATSIWPGAVLRGDYGKIRIGGSCSIQDNVVVHCSGDNPAVVGNGVTVAHNAVVHACKIGDECLIVASAIIFDGAKVGKHSILGVGSVVLEGRAIPARSVAVGVPANVTRRTTDADVRMIRESYKAYVKMARRYGKNRGVPQSSTIVRLLFVAHWCQRVTVSPLLRQAVRRQVISRIAPCAPGPAWVADVAAS